MYSPMMWIGEDNGCVAINSIFGRVIKFCKFYAEIEKYLE